MKYPEEWEVKEAKTYPDKSVPTVQFLEDNKIQISIDYSVDTQFHSSHIGDLNCSQTKCTVDDLRMYLSHECKNIESIKKIDGNNAMKCDFFNMTLSPQAIYEIILLQNKRGNIYDINILPSVNKKTKNRFLKTLKFI